MVYVAVALGGALGAVLRWALGDALPDGAGFPWTTFAVNVTGSLVLAGLPVFDAVRRRQVLAAALGPGLLGGYTTLSAYSEQTRVLLADGQTATGTLLVSVVGSFLLGLFVEAGATGHALALLGTGFCGGFTTYSAFAVQTHRLGPLRGEYAGMTIGLSLAACAVGVVVGQA